MDGQLNPFLKPLGRDQRELSVTRGVLSGTHQGMRTQRGDHRSGILPFRPYDGACAGIGTAFGLMSAVAIVRTAGLFVGAVVPLDWWLTLVTGAGMG